MTDDIDKIQMTVGDFADLFPVLLIEIFAELRGTAKEADQSLENVGSRLLDAAAQSTDPRFKLILTAITESLISSERSS